MRLRYGGTPFLLGFIGSGLIGRALQYLSVLLEEAVLWVGSAFFPRRMKLDTSSSATFTFRMVAMFLTDVRSSLFRCAKTGD